MSRLTFQIGKEAVKGSNVLVWRLPKRISPTTAIVSKQENDEKPRPVFGRRMVFPVG